jgi:hypothetical protein
LAINKNFVVKHGLEVNTDLILANADNGLVGIATTNPQYALHVNGGIGATDVYVSGIATFANNLIVDGVLTANASAGSTGQYLKSTATGVEWASFPNIRTSTFFTATTSQSTFSFSYTPGLVDVFINGVKLANSEYTATDGITVNLINACFGGEIVEIIGYGSISVGVGGSGINGLTILEEGVVTGTLAAVNSINFVGAAVTAVGTGAGVTVYITDTTGTGSTSPWVSTGAGIHTLSNVGVGTTNPRYTLEVGAVGASGTSLWVNGNARVTGILTVGSSSIILDGSTNTINVGTGVTIEGDSGVLKSSGIEVGVITASSIIYSGSTLENLWVSNATGIHTLSNVGVGTTNAEKPLTVYGDIKVTGGGDVIIDEDSAIFFDASDASSPYIEYQNNTEKGLQIVNGTGHDTFVAVGSGNTFHIQEDVLSSYTPNRIASFDYTNGINFYKRLNVSGIVSATQFIGAASSVTVLANNSSATTHYVGFFTNTTGSNNILSDNTLQYVPSTNTLTAGTFDGNVSADNITSGTLSNSRLPSSISLSGNLNVAGVSTFTGNVGIGTTNATEKLTVRGGDISVGIDTSTGLILTSPNGTRYRLVVDDSGNLSTTAV